MPQNQLSVEAFQSIVWDHYRAKGRSLPWRTPQLALDSLGNLDPYHIMVSEIMLQQTQVSRVITKYQEFLEAFPTLQALANASLADVLQLWSGLGYNRRAKFLLAAAKMIATEYDGVIPRTATELIRLPGIGKNTAGAIMAYAFNEPAVFIETNIRTVYIHYFFHDQINISDADLLPLLKATSSSENPREWYWALMDLGSTLKKEVGNTSRLSKTYTKQSKFEGSNRQIRGSILRLLVAGGLVQQDLLQEVSDERAEAILRGLHQEGLVQIAENGMVTLPH